MVRTKKQPVKWVPVSGRINPRQEGNFPGVPTRTKGRGRQGRWCPVVGTVAGRHKSKGSGVTVGRCLCVRQERRHGSSRKVVAGRHGVRIRRNL